MTEEYFMGEAIIMTTESLHQSLYFVYELPQEWPVGEYAVALLINGEQKEVVTFSVE